MDNMVFAGISPHPPIIIPEIGGKELAKVKNTCQAMEQWVQLIKAKKPDTIVIISPHGTVFQDAITINQEAKVMGNLAQFGAKQVDLLYSTDSQLAEAILQMAQRHNVSVVGFDKETAVKHGIKADLDHGAMIPLYYLDSAGVRCQVVSVTMGLLPFEELYAFGLAVQKAARLLDKRVVVVASSDLSHRLTPDAPAGFAPEGQEFDNFLVQTLRNFEPELLQDLDEDLVEKAGECGLRPIIMMLGSLDGLDVEVNILSYEGPFGVGYLVAGFDPLGLNPERELLEKFKHKREKEQSERRAHESEPVKLARQSLEYYLKHGHELTAPELGGNQGVLAGQAGVFVSIKKQGQLRGCIGTTAPTQVTVAAEIIRNAISAGTQDPRFWPIEEDELGDLVYSVDILDEAEPISGPEQLDPAKYGVIVRSGKRSGLLLPNLAGVDSVEEQLAIAKQKAGISPDEDCELQRFEVVRYY